MICKVDRPYCSPLRMQARTAHWPERVAEKFFGGVRRWRYSAGRVSNSDITVSALQIEHAVGPNHFQRNIRMEFAPPGQARNEPSAGKRVRCRDAKRLSIAISPYDSDCRRKCLEPVANGRVQSRARISQRQRSWPAAEQGTPAILLEQSDLVADCGGGHAEFGRCQLETEMPGGGVECAQLNERR